MDWMMIILGGIILSYVIEELWERQGKKRWRKWKYRGKDMNEEILVSICSLARTHFKKGMDPIWVQAEVKRVLTPYSVGNLDFWPLIRLLGTNPNYTDEDIRKAISSFRNENKNEGRK